MFQLFMTRQSDLKYSKQKASFRRPDLMPMSARSTKTVSATLYIKQSTRIRRFRFENKRICIARLFLHSGTA